MGCEARNEQSDIPVVESLKGAGVVCHSKFKTYAFFQARLRHSEFYIDSTLPGMLVPKPQASNVGVAVFHDHAIATAVAGGDGVLCAATQRVVQHVAERNSVSYDRSKSDDARMSAPRTRTVT